MSSIKHDIIWQNITDCDGLIKLCQTLKAQDALQKQIDKQRQKQQQKQVDHQ